MEEEEEEEDPLFSIFTARCHVTSPQSHRTAAFCRHHLCFPAEDDSFPGTVDAESTVVTEEGLEGTRDRGKRPRRVFEGGSAEVVDDLEVGVESVGLDDGNETCGGFGVGNGTAEEGLGGGLGTGFVDLDENQGVGKGPSEDVSAEVVVDLDENEMCGGFSMGNGTAEEGLDGDLGAGFVDLDESEGVGKGLSEDVSAGVVDLDENETYDDSTMRNVVVGEIRAKETWGLDQGMRTRGVGLDGKETCGGFGMGNGTAEKGLGGDLGTGFVDENEGVGKGPSEDVSAEVVGLDENEMCGDLCMGNGGVERGAKENVDTEVVDLDGNETCDDSDMRNNVVGENGGVEKGPKENEHTEVVDLDGNETCDDSDMRNNGVGEIGAKEGGQECRDGNRGFAEKGVEENDKFCRKGKSVVGSSKLCSDLPRTNLYRDGIKRFVTGFQKGGNIRQKGKNIAETRKLPSSVGGQTKNSTDQTENDQIMKNLLDALDIVTRRARKKVDDGSDGKPDFLETAMKRGIVIPRPRWWPAEESDDDQV